MAKGTVKYCLYFLYYLTESIQSPSLIVKINAILHSLRQADWTAWGSVLALSISSLNKYLMGKEKFNYIFMDYILTILNENNLQQQFFAIQLEGRIPV